MFLLWLPQKKMDLHWNIRLHHPYTATHGSALGSSSLSGVDSEVKLPDDGTAAKDAFQDSQLFPPDEVADSSEVNMPGTRHFLFLPLCQMGTHLLFLLLCQMGTHFLFLPLF